METVKVLYIEDDAGSARLLQKRLNLAGFQVDTAADGEIGIAKVMSNSYDVVIVDQNMPHMSGLQVLQKLMGMTSMPITIMLTASGNEKIAVEALKLGASDYLVKDLDGVYLELLPPVIQQCIQQKNNLEEKRKAEEALISSEKYYRSLIEHSLDMIVLTDVEGRIKYVSPSINQIFALTEKDLIGKSGIALIDPTDSGYVDPTVFQNASRFFITLSDQPGEQQEIQFRVKRLDGGFSWLEVRGRNLLHEPWIKAIIFHIRDVTERHLAEEALRESEERFRALLQQSPDANVITDIEGRIIDCNPATEALVGMPRSKMIGETVVHLGVLNNEEVSRIALAYEAHHGMYIEFESNVTRSDGDVITVDLRAIPVSVGGENRILGIARDISWRKQIENQLRSQNQQLVSLSRIDEELTRKLDYQYVLDRATTLLPEISNAESGGVVIASDNFIQHISLFGYEGRAHAEPLMDNLSIVARVFDTAKPEWVENIAHESDFLVLRPGIVSQISLPLVSNDRVFGAIFLDIEHEMPLDEQVYEFLKLVASRFAVAIENSRLFEITQQQISQLQHLNSQISQLERLKTDMISIAAHDLGNPLTNVMLYSSLLKKSLKGVAEEKHITYLDRVEVAATHMKSIISDFLSLDRIERMASATLNRQIFSLLELIEEVYADYLPEAEAKKQEFRLEVIGTEFQVCGFKPELRQATANLVGNAIKYTPDGGAIVLTLLTQDSSVVFEVTDTGYGVPQEAQTRLFEPFFRAVTEETRTISGTGLGLYLVKKTIEHNSGSMLFTSAYQHGSTFGYKLPALTK